MLRSRAIERVDIGQPAATQRPRASAEGRLHARTQRHVRGRVGLARVGLGQKRAERPQLIDQHDERLPPRCWRECRCGSDGAYIGQLVESVRGAAAFQRPHHVIARVGSSVRHIGEVVPAWHEDEGGDEADDAGEKPTAQPRADVTEGG